MRISHRVIPRAAQSEKQCAAERKTVHTGFGNKKFLVCCRAKHRAAQCTLCHVVMSLCDTSSASLSNIGDLPIYRILRGNCSKQTQLILLTIFGRVKGKKRANSEKDFTLRIFQSSTDPLDRPSGPLCEHVKPFVEKASCTPFCF